MSQLSRPIEIFSADGNRSETVEAVVDTGAAFSCLPASLLHRLGIVPARQVPMEWGDGRATDGWVAEVVVVLEGIRFITIIMFASENTAPAIGRYTLTGAALAVAPGGTKLIPAIIRR